ncbi:matrix-remodeling-associated protein 7 isoform X1 [Gouania willdenowi]|uniref:Matrix-remodeling-associated protein 7-like n=1 Tax=Gouania willdenowi TaxID=441366 RepID=A0A8C5DK02_GOUWI|nr:matrix-remodeling-associated protein 7-like isoform X1 [Gouania willdenowi]
MDVTLVLSAVIFTLLAIVVATSLLSDSSPGAESASRLSFFRSAGSESMLNGHIPERTKKKKEAEDWCEMSGSAHDHWEVVKSVQSGAAHTHLYTEEQDPALEPSSAPSSLPLSRPGSQNTNLDVETPSEASSGTGRRSFIALSDTELLKCAFSRPQTEEATESPDFTDTLELDSNDSLKYVPGRARSHHLETMMSKEELEEEQRVQREQLAAIFQLLKDNKETFGDVSEGDMEEQLRLYSI